VFIAFTFFGKEVLSPDFDLVIITLLFAVLFAENLRLVFSLTSAIFKIYDFLFMSWRGFSKRNMPNQMFTHSATPMNYKREGMPVLQYSSIGVSQKIYT